MKQPSNFHTSKEFVFINSNYFIMCKVLFSLLKVSPKPSQSQAFIMTYLLFKQNIKFMTYCSTYKSTVILIL